MTAPDSQEQQQPVLEQLHDASQLSDCLARWQRLPRIALLRSPHALLRQGHWAQLTADHVPATQATNVTTTTFCTIMILL